MLSSCVAIVLIIIMIMPNISQIVCPQDVQPIDGDPVGVVTACSCAVKSIMLCFMTFDISYSAAASSPSS